MMQRTAARFALRFGFFALFPLLVIAGCDSGGGGDGLAPGTFEATVVSDEEEQVEGTASFGFPDEGGGALFSLRLSTGTYRFPERPPLPDSLALPDSLMPPDSLLFPESIETGIFLDAFRTEAPAPGTYAIGSGGGAFGGFGLLTGSAFGFELLVPLWVERGTLTITEASAAQVSGTFEFTASASGFFGNEERIEVSGRFAALAE